MIDFFVSGRKRVGEKAAEKEKKREVISKPRPSEGARGEKKKIGRGGRETGGGDVGKLAKVVGHLRWEGGVGKTVSLAFQGVIWQASAELNETAREADNASSTSHHTRRPSVLARNHVPIPRTEKDKKGGTCRHQSQRGERGSTMPAGHLRIKRRLIVFTSGDASRMEES